MIRMERINGSDMSRIRYRGTMSLADHLSDPLHISTDADVPTPRGWTPAAERQCMLAVVNGLVTQVKKQLVRRMDDHYQEAGTFDNTRIHEDGWIIVDRNIYPGGPRHYRCQITAVRDTETMKAEFILEHPPDLDCAIENVRFYPERLPETIRRTGRINVARREIDRGLFDVPVSPRCRSAGRLEAWNNPRIYGHSFLRDVVDQAYLAARMDSALVRAVLTGGALLRPERDTPKRRAMALLARKIGKARYRDLKKKGYFEEQGRHGAYRFHRDKQGGVTFIQKIKVGALKERTVTWDLCVQSMANDLPQGDVILSRWLEWRNDEDKFLETANFRNIRTGDEAYEQTMASSIGWPAAILRAELATGPALVRTGPLS